VGGRRLVPGENVFFPPNLTLSFSAWLNILAAANKDSPNKLIGIKELLQSFYEIYGRSFFTRYDYEEVPSEGANALIARLAEAVSTGSLDNTKHMSTSTSTAFTISKVYNFSYTDPVTHLVSNNQGLVVLFDDGSRVVFRLSGTGSHGATVRMYVERYMGPEAGKEELAKEAKEGLKGLIEVALEVSKLKDFLGRDQPTVITVKIFQGLFQSYALTMVCSKILVERDTVRGKYTTGGSNWQLNVNSLLRR
jgi:phosphoglucomutase